LFKFNIYLIALTLLKAKHNWVTCYDQVEVAEEMVMDLQLIQNIMQQNMQSLESLHVGVVRIRLAR